ncbi:lactonase family protein [Solimicrobium silvestre]|uniref:Lactonase, 7-bladed beta-propeller n=1 Tax=Solimicrobium silvestre TaxID=2099400 RepID=A0A2S9GX08_9BURK|nr:beta-propeller fold lactonase family protein [Solimicrobium silvestre]PRC92257.1 Lactonase, 7-bladed beta-propeller [Solimicrobium silvestre]
MNLSIKNLLVLLACCGTLLLAGCKGKSTTNNYNIKVTVSGLVGGGVVLQDNLADNLAITGNGVFTFASQLSSNSTYSVTMLTSPSLPAQSCTLANATGTVASSDVTNITLTCVAPEFAYVASSGGSSVATYIINATNGALSSAGPSVTTGNSPVAFAMDPTGRFAFVANSTDKSISSYLGNLTTGLLVSAGPAVLLSNAPNALAVDPLSKFLLVTAGNSIVSYTFNANGVLSSAGTATTGNAPSGIAVISNSSNEYAYVTNGTDNTISGYSVNAAGVLTSLGVVAATGNKPSAISAAPNGAYVYVTNSTDGTISSYPVTATGTLGVATTVASGGNAPVSIAVSASGKIAYVANSTSNNVAAFSISAAGALSSIGTATTGNTPSSVSVDPSGAFVYVVNSTDNNISVYQLTATGALPATVTVLSVGSTPVSVVTAVK